MKRIGILGGTFNPIHNGHLAAGECAVDNLKLDQLILSPCYLPPHKGGRNLAGAQDRLKMVRLACRGNPKFQVSDYEIRQKGKSYSINLVRHLKKKFLANAKLYFIIGEDSLAGLRRWKEIGELQKLVQFVAVNRKGQRSVKSRVRVRFIEMPGLDISSSMIRSCFAKGRSARYLLPDAVIQYIEKRRLYK